MLLLLTAAARARAGAAAFAAAAARAPAARAPPAAQQPPVDANSRLRESRKDVARCGSTPLWVAAHEGHADCVALLLSLIHI